MNSYDVNGGWAADPHLRREKITTVTVIIRFASSIIQVSFLQWCGPTGSATVAEIELLRSVCCCAAPLGDKRRSITSRHHQQRKAFATDYFCTMEECATGGEVGRSKNSLWFLVFYEEVGGCFLIAQFETSAFGHSTSTNDNNNIFYGFARETGSTWEELSLHIPIPDLFVTCERFSPTTNAKDAQNLRGKLKKNSLY